MYNPNLHFHFTGIGGSGMSGLAELLLNLGFRVSGSDLVYSPVCRRLAARGAAICEGHAASNLPPSASLLVFSSAVSADNVELVEARRRGIPVVRRAEVLAELMRLKYGVAVAGSHGKTTTTSLIAAVLESGGLDPTVIIGGQVKALGSGSRLGRGDFLVAETDESDRSFLLLKPTIAVVTNIDAEHLQAYSSLSELEQSFEDFVRAVPFYGLAVLCIDDKRVRDLARRCGVRLVSYGLSPDAQLRAAAIRQDKNGAHFDILQNGSFLCRVDLPLIGRHMIGNSLAAAAVGLEFELKPEAISQALGSFSGVKRRLEVVGAKQGVTVMSDYGHHPSEIKATLGAIREAWGEEVRRLMVIFQPHRYSRTKECFAEFVGAFQDCDELIMTDIYPAGEEPINGISGQLLFEALAHPAKIFVKELEAAAVVAAGRLKRGDLVLCLGAGSVGALPELLLKELPP